MADGVSESELEEYLCTCCVGEAENMGGVAHGDGAGVWWPTKQTEGSMAGRS